VAISYQTKTGQPDETLSEEAIKKEKQALMKVYNLEDIKLLTRDSLVLKKGEQTAQFQEVILKNRELKVQVTPVAEKEDVFKLEVLEKNKGRKAVLETEILIPQEKVGSLGFEGVERRIYYLSFNRLKDREENGEQTMQVFFYKRPQLVRKVNPEYPEKALDEWIQGTVVLDTEIDTGGNVREVSVIKSAHKLLDEAAKTAVKQWKYKPFRVKGGMDSLIFTVNIRFELIPAPQTAQQPSRLRPRLIHRVAPVYPWSALKAHIEGDVVLEVENDIKGNVKKVRVVSGHPRLKHAAVQAVKKWKYEPYMINGEPKRVLFTEIVSFRRRGSYHFYKK
jgi:TonB family protein